jgi:outer membrane protein OmpA-like peptidoglycan-associated protein
MLCKTYFVLSKEKSTFLFLLFLISATVFVAPSANAQINLKKKVNLIKNKVNNKIDQKINKEIDKTLDEAEDLLLNDKSKSTSKDSSQKGNTANTKSTATTTQQNTTTSTAPTSNTTDSLTTAYVSKFDFVPGEKIIAIEGFEQEQIGDFPSMWDTDASGEVVVFSGSDVKWLKLGKDGFFLPEFYKELPENFTMEFDVKVNEAYSWFSSALGMAITNSEATATWKPDKRQRTSSGVIVNIHPVNAEATGGRASIVTFLNGTEVMNSEQEQQQFSTAWRLNAKPTTVHVSLWKQGQRLRIYFNEKKYWDLPKAFNKEIKHNKLFFLTRGGKENEHFFISGFKLAEGTPNTRSKLITEGSFTTNGITFDVNSARLKEASYGVIREIATVLTENPTVRIKIIGHTDSDGGAALNQELSIKRATSVQEALIANFSIDKSRIEVEGKGSSMPVAENNSPLNKALNRRVQFVKL